MEPKRLQIAADDRMLAQVRDFVGRACSELGFGARAVANVRLAVDEACTNVVKHAYGSRPGDMTIDITARRGWLEIRILEQGEPFDGKVEIPHLGRYIDGKRKGGLGIFLMHRLMDDVRYRSTPAGNEWLLRKRLPHSGRGLRGSLRVRYVTRAALALVAVTALACVPLWVREGSQRRGADERALRGLAFGLAEAARPVLLQRAELSAEQTRLFEAVHTLLRQEPRLLSVSVVDADGLIWAADRASATFTHFVPPAVLGRADGAGVRRGVQHLEQQPVLHLSAPVRVAADAASGRDLGGVHLALRWGATEAAVRAARLRLVLGALLLDLLGTALVAALVGTLLRPLQRLLEAIRNPGAGGGALEVGGPEEIGAIAAAWNDIQARFQAAQASAAQNERLQQEMQLAQEIQSSILPQEVPELPGFEIARLYRPAQEVGGDYYDFLDVGDGLTGVVVADAAGKGVSGSLVMTMIRTALRMESRNNANAGDVLSRMHAFVSPDLRKGMFVTVFYVILDSRNRVVSYASAGHNPMLLHRAASGESFFLNPRGIPVGLATSDTELFQRSLDVERLRLRAGDLLLLYTDGVTEATNPAGEQFGESRLLEAVQRSGGGSAQEFVQGLERDLLEFIGPGPAADDITLVAIRDRQTAPELSGSLRQRLLDLVERQGMPVAEACRRLEISPSTYYRFKRAGGADELELQHLSVEKRERLLQLVAQHPEMGPRELAEALREPRWGGIEVAPTLLHAELRRLELQTFERRSALAQACAAARRPGSDGSAVIAAVAAAPEPIGPAPRATAAAAGEAPSEAGSDAELFVQQGSLRALATALDDAAGCGVVHLEGCLDSGSCAALAGLLERAAGRWTRLVVDLSAVAYVSSRGWGLLASDPCGLRARGGDLVLCGMRRELLDVYRMLGFEAVLLSFADRDAARAGFGAGPAAPPTAAAAAIATPARVAPVVPAAGLPTGEALAGLDSESLRVRTDRLGAAGEVTLLALDGILDTVSARRFERVLERVVQECSGRIVVDLSRTEFVSSCGWGAFTAHLGALRQRGGDLKLFGMNPQVSRIYDLLHLRAVLASFDLLAQALQDFGIEPARPPAETAELPAATAAPAVRPAAPSPAAAVPTWTESRHAAATAVAVADSPPDDKPLAACEFGALVARLEATGPAGRALRVRLFGAWSATHAADLESWLLESVPPCALLVVDARALPGLDAEAWRALQRCTQLLAESGRHLQVQPPETPSGLPPSLGWTLYAGLQPAGARGLEAGAALHDVRLPASEFDRDASVRSEGWASYLWLLREACAEDS
jgi:anti-anti-sigma factor